MKLLKTESGRIAMLLDQDFFDAQKPPKKSEIPARTLEGHKWVPVMLCPSAITRAKVILSVLDDYVSEVIYDV